VVSRSSGTSSPFQSHKPEAASRGRETGPLALASFSFLVFYIEAARSTNQKVKKSGKEKKKITSSVFSPGCVCVCVCVVFNRVLFPQSLSDIRVCACVMSECVIALCTVHSVCVCVCVCVCERGWMHVQVSCVSKCV